MARIRNIFYDTASSVMFNTLGWPTIEKRHYDDSYMHNKAVLTYKALNNLTPMYNRTTSSYVTNA